MHPVDTRPVCSLIAAVAVASVAHRSVPLHRGGHARLPNVVWAKQPRDREMSERPAIPASVRQQLRREAWHGCCLCGNPFIEYHHILGWQQTGEVADEMMVLCPNCHHLATVGALPMAEQRSLKAMPFNRKRGFASRNLSMILRHRAGRDYCAVGTVGDGAGGLIQAAVDSAAGVGGLLTKRCGVA